MRKYLVFDTETTGLPPRAARGAPPIPATDPRQPRLASFAAIIADESGVEIERIKRYIKPDGWSMKAFDDLAIAEGIKPASAINGLHDDFLHEHGVPVQGVLEDYSSEIRSGLIACAFNAVFDLKIMRGELRRAGMDDLFEDTPNLCMMRALDPYGADGLPIMRGFVKLTAAAEFFGFELDAHEVMSDALGARWILERLIKDGRLPEPSIKRAANYGGGTPPPPPPPAPPERVTEKLVDKTGKTIVPDQF